MILSFVATYWAGIVVSYGLLIKGRRLIMTLRRFSCR